MSGDKLKAFQLIPLRVQQLAEGRYGHLFPRNNDSAELAAAEKALLRPAS